MKRYKMPQRHKVTKSSISILIVSQAIAKLSVLVSSPKDSKNSFGGGGSFGLVKMEKLTFWGELNN